MKLEERRQRLEVLLLSSRDLWHPQPFREPVLPWFERYPGLAEELRGLDDETVSHLNDDCAAAAALVARYLAPVETLAELVSFPVHAEPPALSTLGAHWAWEIPGRKRRQIEAFAAAVSRSGKPVIDWCCGKGHLGRLLALAWQVPVTGLEFDAVLCGMGQALAARAGVAHEFVVADALATEHWPRPGQHAVALHACGDLHRSLIVRGSAQGVARFDVAPCCYYRGVGDYYEPLSLEGALRLTRDDVRLAVTETVTAAPRECRARDREMAWKLGFDAWRRSTAGGAYRNFKPVPEAWMRGSFADFIARMAEREGLPLTAGLDEFERQGWRRQHEVMRFSVVRHAFRRALESWLVLDLAGFLEARGYEVGISVFCERRLTPRNLLLSAQRN